MEERRKHWTEQQSELRKALSSAVNFAQGMQLFLEQHAVMHTAEISGGRFWSLHDEALAGVTEEQFRFCPRPEINSIAWLLWHITRIEDMTMHFLVLEQPQVLMRADWTPRLGLALRDCGAGMSEAEVEDFSAQISMQGLIAYRYSVGRSVYENVQGLHPAQLKEIVPTWRVEQLCSEGSISEKAGWLAGFYTNRPKGFFLTRTATSHNFLHLNQAARLNEKLHQAQRVRTLA
jgi:hypothetical protein